jgi:hypothetical protein
MRLFPRPLLGLILAVCLVAPLPAQKKKSGGLILEAPELPAVPQIPNAFAQVVGTQIIGPAYKFGKEDATVEGAREIAKLGSRILKVQMPSPAQFTELVGMPFTHYLLWFRTGNEWKQGMTPELRRKEYNATYLFAKDLLTRRDTTGKTFFIGHWEGDWALLPNMDPNGEFDAKAAAAMVEWLNIRQEAVDDARREVPYTRCRVYTYAEVNRVMDAFKGGKQRMINAVIPKTNVDFLSYSAYDVQTQPAETVRAALDYANQQLPPKAGLPARRVFIGECGLSWTACGGDGKVHEQRNREILAKFLAWRPAIVLYWQLYNNEVKDGKQVGFWLIDDKNRKTPLYETFKDLLAQQEEVAREMQQRSRRLPSFEEIAAFSENWLNQRGR